MVLTEAKNLKVLLLGFGLQGKAVAHDLEQVPSIQKVIAADMEVGQAKEHLYRHGYKKVKVVPLDASREGELNRLVKESDAQIVISMLPVAFGYRAARAALDAGIPYVSSNYTGQVAELHDEALKKGITILPEMGMDPGDDLLLGRMAISELDEVRGLYSYGGGLPGSSCADNPIRYKITWTFDGVLKSYVRPALILKDGKEISISGTDIFKERYIHSVKVPGLGKMEAYPNGDAVRYIDVFGLGKNVRHMGRFALRWPGHCQFWRVMVDLGFLEETPKKLDGISISPRQFLVHHLEPRLQFQQKERDLVIIQVQAWGLKDGREKTITYRLLDYRDLATGLFAMNRTVGYTASIGAQMILSGKIRKPGVLSPARDVPVREVLRELEARGMQISRRVQRGNKLVMKNDG
jgi:lysine 6-dehydrogenase